METYSPVVPAVKDVKRLDEIRKSAKFHPSIWGDFFLSYNSDNTQICEAEEEEVAKQKEAVGELLAQVPEGSTYKMELIDLIQRLGVNYHFEKEIHDSLNYIHENSQHNDDELRTTALRFRLLRQQGYHVPCDVFRKFTDGEGNFATALPNDVEGLLELYEASHLATRGEEILDRAMEFSSSHLQALLNQQLVGSVSLSKRVDEALKMPIRKTLTRIGARKFISLYQEDESHNEVLLNFAKLDFNMVQKMHQRELSDATRWWKKLEVAKRMPYARDRIVELFFWVVGVYFEPCYSTARRILIKAISMASIMDDTYEYATLDELQILTDAIRRWDVNETLEDLPPYVHMCYKALIQAYAEIEDEVVEKFGGGASYRIEYAIGDMKKLVMAYFEEVKWLYNNRVPTVEEYMKVSLVTCGYMMLSTTSLVGVGSDRVSKADFDWIVNEPLIVRASCVICRLMDDLVGDEYEEKPSSVLCYVKQYVVSKDEARARLKQQVKDVWKDMNEECIEPRPASMHFLTWVLNLGRVIHLLYGEGDSYTDPNRSKEWVKMVFVDPI